MWTGIQWTGTVAAGVSDQFFTFGWPAEWHVVWYVMPTTVQPGAPQLDWDVAVERGDEGHCTYWITVTNLTTVPVDFEGRFAVLT
ncbi:MAG TPA: hypothetical protein VF612_15885 [Jatrophihabitans sp.]|jgi:hypothetical protein|uniref:hypothetical protein n=1 Tax=Jatrophihabitans sp. TaxID=1932789 RepID=UPI002F23224D